MLHNALFLVCVLAAGALPSSRRPVTLPIAAGATFTVDVGGTRHKLGELAPDDQPDQVADWAVLGALYRAGLSQDAIAKALYDKVPFRDPALEEVATFDYGAGRHVNLKGETWLFRPELDPHPEATVGRLADQARMELGAIPARFSVFTYQSDLAKGQLRVTLVARVPGASLFRPEAGYVEKDVSTAAELGSWLASVDDVTFVSFLDGGAVRFGGRRFRDARTPGATMDDVAALAFAHRTIEERWKAIADPERIIKTFNEALEQAKAGERWVASNTLARAELELSRIDGLPPRHTSGGDIADREILVQRFREASGRIDQLQVPWKEYQKKLVAAGGLLRAPGFSLDPTWDSARLSNDLRLLRDEPLALMREAVQITQGLEGRPWEDPALPVEHHAALELVSLAAKTAKEAGSGWQPALSPEQQRAVSHTRSLCRSDHVEEAGLAVYAAARYSDEAGVQSPAPSSTVSRDLYTALHRFVRARAQVQCARYDGPLRGTHVGMVLFYTDLMAKVWGSVDYHRSAPVDDVSGFRSEPRLGATIEPAYWDEMRRLSSTRIWFGPRRDAMSQSPGDREIHFGHIGARVYAAGSDPLKPNDESRPSELSRRVVGWWDRHYAAVADYEPQFHAQNQIMKWSVITGLLNDRGRLADVADQPVDRSATFDRWLATAPDLRFRQDVRMLPRSRWLQGNECMERLVSYTFESGGTGGSFITGGVSLGSAESMGAHARIGTKVAQELRRGGLDYSAGEGALKTLRGTQYTFGKAETAAARTVQVEPPKTAVLRAGGLELRGEQSMELGFTRGKGGSAAIELKVGEAPLGKLQVQTVRGDSVALSWKDDLGTAQRRLASAVADMSSESGRLARLPVPESFAQPYMQQGQEGLQVFAGKVGRGAREPLMAFREGGERSGATLSVVSRKTGRAISATPMDEGSVHEALRSSRWQRVSVEDGGGRPALARVFTNDAPSPSARTVEVALNEDLHVAGFVDRGGLYLDRLHVTELADRPAISGPAQVAFDDVVTRRGWTPEAVQRVVAGGPARELSAGRPSQAARAFAYGDQPEAHLARVLDRLDGRDLAGAAEAANAVPPASSLKLLANESDFLTAGGDQAEVAVRLRATTLQDDVRARAAIDQVTVQPSGNALVSEARLNRPLRATPLTERERVEAAARIASGKATAYVEDGGILTKKDWDFSPRRGFSEAAKDPRVVWEAFDASELGGLAPGALKEGERSFVRRSGAWQLGAAAALAGTAGAVYRLRSCDRDGDGEVSEEELRRCG